MTTHPDAGSRTDGPALFIAGRWVRAGDGGVRECVNPTDGTVFATVDEATPEDAARAVAAARAAFDSGPWPSTSVGERAAVLHRIADLLARDREPLARIETDDTGQTLAESRMDVDDVIAVFRYYAGVLVSSADRVVDVGDRQVISRVTREPIGVCVLIAPWNYPPLQMSWKVAPALAAGCTMIMKPSEVTPLSTIAFTRLVEEAGVPDGVGGRLLLPADDLRPLRPDGAHRPGEDVRTDPHRGTLLHDCRGDRPGQRHDVRPRRRDQDGRPGAGRARRPRPAARHRLDHDYGAYTAAAEWGGFKRSGNGRELGPSGLAEYQELKHIWQHTAPTPKGRFDGRR